MRALWQAAIRIGRALSPLVDVVNPEHVVIGGALRLPRLSAGDRPAAESIRSVGASMATDSVTLVRSGLTERTSVRGAVGMALIECASSYLQHVGG